MNTPLETQELVKTAAEKKAEMDIKSLLLKGFLAGLLIAFAALASTIAAMNLLKTPETYGLGKFVQGFVFSGGLIMVVLSGAELFTGNNLMFTALFDRRIGSKKMLKNWGFVYLGNFLGSLFLALLVASSGIFNANSGLLGETLAGIANTKASLAFFPALSLGVLCNILVCLAVYMAFGAKTTPGKLLACIFPITFFVMMGFEHSIANMFYLPAGFLASGNINLLGFFQNIIPVTIGNILGGLLLSTIFYFSSNQKRVRIKLCKAKKKTQRTKKTQK